MPSADAPSPPSRSSTSRCRSSAPSASWSTTSTTSTTSAEDRRRLGGRDLPGAAFADHQVGEAPGGRQAVAGLPLVGHVLDAARDGDVGPYEADVLHLDPGEH